VADVAAGLAWLTSEPGIERAAVVGFSAGGHLSYLAACRLPVSRTAVAAGVDHEQVSYPGVGHAFFWPGTPPFVKAARDDAWRRIVELLAS
jgi:carboxymethylenebutenolidase